MRVKFLLVYRSAMEEKNKMTWGGGGGEVTHPRESLGRVPTPRVRVGKL